MLMLTIFLQFSEKQSGLRSPEVFVSLTTTGALQEAVLCKYPLVAPHSNFFKFSIMRWKYYYIFRAHELNFNLSIEISLKAPVFLQIWILILIRLWLIHMTQGRNQTAINIITRNRELFTWEVAYLGLKSEVVPFKMRAKFCSLLVGEFTIL